MQTSRRFTILIAVMMLFAATLALTGTATATSHNGPYTLYAGQDIPVGEVTVTNDTVNMYFTFSTESSVYCMLETHLQVGDVFAPTTRTGNPIPGNFEFSTDHDCVKTYTYTVPLGDLVSEVDIDFAAHAEVKAPVAECWDEVWMIGDVEVPTEYTYGPFAGETLLTNYADEFNWGDPADPFTLGPGLADESPDFADPFIVGFTPEKEFPYNSNTVREYATDFDVEWSDHLHFGGKLTVSWSPGASAREVKNVSGDGIALTTFTRPGASVSGQGYFLDRYPVYEDTAVVAPLGDGTHTINFTHTTGDGTFWDWVLLERPCETYESAWSEGTRFVERGNWATYSSYEVQKVLVDTVQVPGTDPIGVESSIALAEGVDFEFRASGTYRFANWGDAGIADAQCSYRVVGAAWVNGDDLSSPNFLEVWVDEEAFDWEPGDCDPDNLYSGMHTGDGTTAEFFIPDSCGGGVLGCYGDNSGFITVHIYWVG